MINKDKEINTTWKSFIQCHKTNKKKKSVTLFPEKYAVMLTKLSTKTK